MQAEVGVGGEAAGGTGVPGSGSRSSSINIKKELSRPAHSWVVVEVAVEAVARRVQQQQQQLRQHQQ